MTSAPANTRERLLRAAAAEIALHGYRGASLRGVAARAEIRAATIFHHFPGGKEELAQALLQHIMDTIATRMTPTIDAAAAVPPVDLIVQCAALLWDFMSQHPEYAGALLKEAFSPESVLTALVRERAEAVVGAAVAFFESCQAQGLLAPLDVRRFLLRMASFVLTFHGAPSMRQHILGPAAPEAPERAAFLAAIRADLTPPRSAP